MKSVKQMRKELARARQDYYKVSKEVAEQARIRRSSKKMAYQGRKLRRNKSNLQHAAAAKMNNLKQQLRERGETL